VVRVPAAYVDVPVHVRVWKHRADGHRRNTPGTVLLFGNDAVDLFCDNAPEVFGHLHQQCGPVRQGLFSQIDHADSLCDQCVLYAPHPIRRHARLLRVLPRERRSVFALVVDTHHADLHSPAGAPRNRVRHHDFRADNQVPRPAQPGQLRPFPPHVRDPGRLSHIEHTRAMESAFSVQSRRTRHRNVPIFFFWKRELQPEDVGVQPHRFGGRVPFGPHDLQP